MPRVDIFTLSKNLPKTRIVMLTLTERCNLRCTYCYEPSKRSDRRMSLQTAQNAITKYMEMDDEFAGVEFDLFGGEPLLEFDLIRQLVDWFHSKEWRKQHIFACATNGTVLDDTIKQWLTSHRCVLPALSLDGNKAAHDLNRSNSYDSVIRHLPFFQEHWPEQPLKMTISAASIPHIAESVIELEERGLLFSANVAFEDIWGSAQEKERLLGVYAEQLDRLVDYYAARPDLVPVKLVGHQLEATSPDALARSGPGDCVRWCGAGHEMLVIDTDGTEFPCHRFAPWITGRPAPQEAINRQARWKPDACAECRLVGICPVCAGFNWQENGDTGTRTTYHCEAFKLEVQASAKLKALRLLAQSKQDVERMKPEDAYTTQLQLDAILEFIGAEG